MLDGNSNQHSNASTPNYVTVLPHSPCNIVIALCVASLPRVDSGRLAPLPFVRWRRTTTDHCEMCRLANDANGQKRGVEEGVIGSRINKPAFARGQSNVEVRV